MSINLTEQERKLKQILQQLLGTVDEKMVRPPQKTPLETDVERLKLLVEEQSAAINALTGNKNRTLNITGSLTLGDSDDECDEGTEEDDCDCYDCDECDECDECEQETPITRDPFKPETGINMQAVYNQIQRNLRQGTVIPCRNREDYECALTYGVSKGEDYSNRIVIILGDSVLDQ